MKVLGAIVALLISITPFMPAAAAKAETYDGREYARADRRNIYLCSEMKPESALFALPYTYCVEVLGEYDGWLLVKYGRDEDIYKSVTGYCKSDGLTPVDTPPENLYLNMPVEVTLRSDVPDDGSIPGLKITVTAAYYGVYYKGAAAYSCVLYDGKFCYVGENFEDYPLNEIPSEPTFAPTDQTPQNEGGAKLYAAIGISAMALAAVAFLFFTGKRKPKGGVR